MAIATGLDCRGLTFAWPGKRTAHRTVLASIDAPFAPGSISLITGDTGAGKSTLLHVLAGLLRPTAGEVWADGQPVSRWPASHRDRWRRQVGIVFQHLALIPDISAAENLLLALFPKRLSWSGMQTSIRKQLIAADLEELAHIPAGDLSGGQRQRLAVARAMVAAPRFILADEPTAFQDDDHAHGIIEQLQAAVAAGAVAVVCSQDPRLKQSAAMDQHYHLVSGRLHTGAGGGNSP